MTVLAGQSVDRTHPMWCRVYARKTPAIPVHNGHVTCLGCGADVVAIRRALTQEQLS